MALEQLKRRYTELIVADNRYDARVEQLERNAYERAFQATLARMVNPVWLAPAPADPDMQMDEGL